METLRAARNWSGPPLALQIVGLLMGGLVVAQLVTMFLTLVLPPEPQPQYGLNEIARALSGTSLHSGKGRPLQRVVQLGPPALEGPGWLTSDRSRHELAQMLGRSDADVQLFFFTPLPFAGVTHGLERRAGLERFAPPVFTRAQFPVTAGAFPGGGFPGGFPGGGYPGAGLPTGGFPNGGLPHPVIMTAPATPPVTVQPVPMPLPATTNMPTVSAPVMVQPPVVVAPPVTASAPTVTPAIIPNASLPNVLPQAAVGQIPAVSRPVTSLPHFVPGGLTGVMTVTRPVAPPVPAVISVPGLAAPSVANIPVPPPVREQPRAEIKPPAIKLEATHVPVPALTPPPRPHLASNVPLLIAPSVAVPTPSVRPRPLPHLEATVPLPAPRGLFGLAPAPYVEGDFVAAMMMDDGRWTVVQPTPEPFPNSWQRRVVLWFLISFALVAPVGWLFARRLVRPIAGFAHAAEQLGRDPTAPIMPLEGPAEMGRAAHAFNRMQSRLRSFVDDRTAMVGAISHDLRTPLTRLRFRLEDVPDELRDPMLAEVDEMEQMISSVLAFIRDASEPGSREMLDLRSIVEDVVEDAVFVGKPVTLAQAENAPVEVDPLGMRRLLGNLVENAVKYGDNAQVRLFTDRQDVVAEVQDDGPGLPDGELERVFQPFYRAPAARASDKHGTGLGLAVCRSIARAHGGDVKLRRGERGLVAQVRLPLAYGMTHS